jgi:hypothetical protein
MKSVRRGKGTRAGRQVADRDRLVACSTRACLEGSERIFHCQAAFLAMLGISAIHTAPVAASRQSAANMPLGMNAALSRDAATKCTRPLQPVVSGQEAPSCRRPEPSSVTAFLKAG